MTSKSLTEELELQILLSFIFPECTQKARAETFLWVLLFLWECCKAAFDSIFVQLRAARSLSLFNGSTQGPKHSPAAHSKWRVLLFPPTVFNTLHFAVVLLPVMWSTCQYIMWNLTTKQKSKETFRSAVYRMWRNGQFEASRFAFSSCPFRHRSIQLWTSRCAKTVPVSLGGVELRNAN